MKFSVAPESRSVGVLTLLFDMWIKVRNDIDCRFDRYTCSELNALTKADIVRCCENPAAFHLFPFSLLLFPFPPLTEL